MSIQDFRNEVLNHYLEAGDLHISPIRDPWHWSTANGLLYSAFFYTILRLNGCLTEDDRVRYITAVDRCWVRRPDGSSVEGLLNRNWDRHDEQAQDDYHTATASYFVQTDHAAKIYSYGESNRFSYDNQNPNKFKLNKWHGRFIGRPGFYALAARKDQGCVQDQLIKQDIRLGPSKDAGALLQQWLRNQVYKQYSNYSKAVQDWEARHMAMYVNLSTSIKGEMGNREDHPFVKYKFDVYGKIS